ncbi:MAG: hypothetical protein ABIA93_04580 [Candidatus Woesearchaeota archaeon]
MIACHDLRKKMEEETLLAKGKRGEVFVTGRGTVIKRLRPGTAAKHAIDLEAHYLKKANELGLGPRFIRANENEIEMEYIEGARIGDYLAKATLKQREAVIRKIMKQLELLDKEKLFKKELTNPYKHIIVRNHEPILIDWERARHTEKPKNVAQFREYVSRHLLVQ